MTHRKKLLLSTACLLLATLLMAVGSYAWLSKVQSTKDTYVALSDFHVEGNLTFSGAAPATTSVMIPVSFSPTDSNYIGNLKYTVNYSGVSPAWIRVRVLEQWLNATTNEVMPANYLNYFVAGSASRINTEASDTIQAAGPGSNLDALAVTGMWVDNRTQDYCYYYSVPVQPKQLTTPKGSLDTDAVSVGDGSISLPLIDQTNPAANTAQMIAGIDPNTTQLTLLIEVEAVQPNRFREFWGIDAIPTP